jgi:hypothetical protein
MRKFALAVAIAIAASMVAPVAAQEPQTRKEYRRMNRPENLPASIKTFHNKRFTVLSYRTQEETGHHPSPGSAEQVAQIRSAIRSNKWLVEQLKVKKVTPSQILWAWRARNGNMVFYID